MSNLKKSMFIWPIIVIIIWLHFTLKNIFNIDIFWWLEFSKIWPLAVLWYWIYILMEVLDKKGK